MYYSTHKLVKKKLHVKLLSSALQCNKLTHTTANLIKTQ